MAYLLSSEYFRLFLIPFNCHKHFLSECRFDSTNIVLHFHNLLNTRTALSTTCVCPPHNIKYLSSV
nr:MAG TPA: hypothetical protein [Caudoviricetes sp.]